MSCSRSTRSPPSSACQSIRSSSSPRTCSRCSASARCSSSSPASSRASATSARPRGGAGRRRRQMLLGALVTDPDVALLASVLGVLAVAVVFSVRSAPTPGALANLQRRVMLNDRDFAPHPRQERLHGHEGSARRTSRWHAARRRSRPRREVRSARSRWPHALRVRQPLRALQARHLPAGRPRLRREQAERRHRPRGRPQPRLQRVLRATRKGSAVPDDPRRHRRQSRTTTLPSSKHRRRLAASSATRSSASPSSRSAPIRTRVVSCKAPRR